MVKGLKINKEPCPADFAEFRAVWHCLEGQRSRRYVKFEVTGDPGYGYATKDGMSIWFYRTEGERR